MPQCEVDLNISVKDSKGDDVTSLWKQYIQLLQRIQTCGQGSKAPPPISVSHCDPLCSRQHTTQRIVVEASLLEIAAAVTNMSE
eukprot:9493985-Prorocentrum_lima.AAC.1